MADKVKKSRFDNGDSFEKQSNKESDVIEMLNGRDKQPKLDSNSNETKETKQKK